MTAQGGERHVAKMASAHLHSPTQLAIQSYAHLLEASSTVFNVTYSQVSMQRIATWVHREVWFRPPGVVPSMLHPNGWVHWFMELRWFTIYFCSWVFSEPAVRISICLSEYILIGGCALMDLTSGQWVACWNVLHFCMQFCKVALTITF